MSGVRPCRLVSLLAAPGAVVLLALLQGCRREAEPLGGGPSIFDPFGAYAYLPPGNDLYEEMLREAAHSPSFPVRYACIRELIRSVGDEPALALLVRKVNEPGEASLETEVAAYVLQESGNDAALEAVAPYFVSRLRLASYGCFDPFGGAPHRHGGGWLAIATRADGTQYTVFVLMTCAGHEAEQLGRYAVPHLVALLSDESIEARRQAFCVLRGITGLRVPYDVDARVDLGVAPLLKEKGWLRAGQEHEDSPGNTDRNGDPTTRGDQADTRPEPPTEADGP